jgi:membrane protein implicated in regulation of membrane protease activity
MLDSALWSAWWVWIAAGLVLAILEMVLPGFIFLGFAIGAVIMGLLLATGLLPLTAPWVLVGFAALSLVAYLALRSRLRSGRGEMKIITRDINDNPHPK